MQRDYDGAIEDCNKAIQLDPMYAKAYNVRGNAEKEKGNHDGALADYNKAIELDPKYAAPYYNRGNTKSLDRDYQGAISDYTKAIELDPSDPDARANRGMAKEKIGDDIGAVADYEKAVQLDRANIESYGALITRASLARNKQVVDAETKASQEDPKFGADIKSPTPDGSPPKGYDLITVTYSSQVPDKNSQTQVIQRHRFVDGKFVKTEEIYHVTEYGVPGIRTDGTGGPIIWRNRYLVSYNDLDILDLWTGKKKFFGYEAPPPNHIFNVVSVNPEQLIVANVHTTARDMKSAIADIRLFRLREPNGKLEPLPQEEKPFWPVLPSLSALYNSWEISPDGNRRVIHPAPGEKPAPEEGLWFYDKQKAEKKFLADSFYDPSKAPGPDRCILWLDNDRFVTLRPDGEVILVQWNGIITSLGHAPKPSPGKNDLILDRDGAGRILIVKYWLGTDTTSLVDVDAKTVTKATNWKLGHDWEVSLPMGPNTPVELRHAGELITKTITAAGPPLVSPDGLNVAMPDYDKLQNGDAFQKGYLRIYSLVTKGWVDFPATERPIAWIPAAPEMK